MIRPFGVKVSDGTGDGVGCAVGCSEVTALRASSWAVAVPAEAKAKDKSVADANNLIVFITNLFSCLNLNLDRTGEQFYFVLIVIVRVKALQ